MTFLFVKLKNWFINVNHGLIHYRVCHPDDRVFIYNFAISAILRIYIFVYDVFIMTNVRLLPVAISCQSNHCYLINPIRIFDCLIPTVCIKLGCVVRMVVDSILPHAESGLNDQQKDAPPFI